MPKSFEEFIVKSGVLPTDQLILAFIHQCKNRRHVAETIYSHQLLPIETQLSIILNSILNKSTYQTSAESLGCWSPEIEKKISTLEQAKLCRLTDVILELELLNPEKMTLELQKYLEFRNHSAHDQECSSTDPLPKNSNFDVKPLTRLIRQFENHAGPKILEVISLLEDKKVGKTVLSKNFTAILSELDTLKSIANKVGMQSSELQLSKVNASVFPALDKNFDKNVTSQIQFAVNQLELAYQVIKTMCEFLAEFGEECPVESDKVINELQEKLLSNLKDYQLTKIR
jgi:hypothetical protein